MSTARRSLQRRFVRWFVFSLTCGSLSVTVHADAWSQPAGRGSIDLMLRQFDAARVFLPDQFGPTTLPGSELRYTMVRLAGVHGLGARLSVQYDLRAARIEKVRTHHGVRTVTSSTGLQDQQIGLTYALTQRADFADSVAVNVIAATGSVSAAPSLGVGHTAVEADLLMGLAGRRWRISLMAGSRIFLDGAAAQMRVEFDASTRLSRRVELGVILFYVRTLALKSPLRSVDRSERYDLFRPGVRFKYRVTSRFKPFVEYEQAVAGRDIHAGRRVTVGVTYSY